MDVGHECSKRGANNSRMPRQGLDTRQIDCRVDWDGRRGKNDEVDLTQLGYISTFLKLRPPDSRPRLIWHRPCGAHGTPRWPLVVHGSLCCLVLSTSSFQRIWCTDHSRRPTDAFPGRVISRVHSSAYGNRESWQSCASSSANRTFSHLTPAETPAPMPSSAITISGTA